MVKTRKWRLITQLVLAAGAVLSFAAMFGSIWVVRAGIVLAVLAAVAAVVAAWREISHHLDAKRRELADQNLQLSRAHGTQLRSERQHNASVLDTVRGQIEQSHERIAELSDQVTDHRAKIAELRRDISALRGDKASLSAQVVERDHRITGLLETLTVRESELAALLADDDEAEVYAMPRRVRTDAARSIPQAEWETGNQPTVADLAAVDAQGRADVTAENQQRKQA